jgi:zona occludens toxin (predicted ATPase)
VVDNYEENPIFPMLIAPFTVVAMVMLMVILCLYMLCRWDSMLGATNQNQAPTQNPATGAAVATAPPAPAPEHHSLVGFLVVWNAVFLLIILLG